MTEISRRTFILALLVLATTGDKLGQRSPQAAEPLTVITSGAFAAAQLQLAPQFERTSGSKVTTIDAPSMGSGPDTIPGRLARGEAVDVVIMSSGGLEDLIKQG